MATALAMLMLILGVLGVLRSVAIVVLGGEGRFRLDPVVSLMAGLALVLAGSRLLA